MCLYKSTSHCGDKAPYYEIRCVHSRMMLPTRGKRFARAFFFFSFPLAGHVLEFKFAFNVLSICGKGFIFNLRKRLICTLSQPYTKFEALGTAHTALPHTNIKTHSIPGRICRHFAHEWNQTMLKDSIYKRRDSSDELLVLSLFLSSSATILYCL